jgi:hypothetical protein
MTPRKLAAAIKKHRDIQHLIADELGVNPYYVNRWMKFQEEPVNSITRQRMGFPKLRKKHSGRSGFAELPVQIQWWRKLKKDKRDEYILNNYDYIVRNK